METATTYFSPESLGDSAVADCAAVADSQRTRNKKPHRHRASTSTSLSTPGITVRSC